MFSLLKFIIYIAGLVVVASFVLGYFGYEVNRDYFSTAKKQCREELIACQKEVLYQGIDNAQCSFDCGDPRLIIRKK